MKKKNWITTTTIIRFNDDDHHHKVCFSINVKTRKKSVKISLFDDDDLNETKKDNWFLHCQIDNVHHYHHHYWIELNKRIDKQDFVLWINLTMSRRRRSKNLNWMNEWNMIIISINNIWKTYEVIIIIISRKKNSCFIHSNHSGHQPFFFSLSLSLKYNQLTIHAIENRLYHIW